MKLQDDWEAVYQEYVPDVYKFLLYFTGNHEDAQDITQETFIKAFVKWEQNRHLLSVKAWLLTIARNIAVDRLRKRSRTQNLFNLLRSEPVYTPQLPEELVNATERKRELYAAIQSMKPEYRAVTILRGVQDQTPSETAEILQWTQNKVNVMYHRAIKMLRDKMPEGRW